MVETPFFASAHSRCCAMMPVSAVTVRDFGVDRDHLVHSLHVEGDAAVHGQGPALRPRPTGPGSDLEFGGWLAIRRTRETSAAEPRVHDEIGLGILPSPVIPRFRDPNSNRLSGPVDRRRSWKCVPPPRRQSIRCESSPADRRGRFGHCGCLRVIESGLLVIILWFCVGGPGLRHR